MGMRSSVSFRVVPGWTLSAISTPVTGEDRWDAAKQDKDKARPAGREERPTAGERAVHIPRSPQRAAPLCGERTSLFSSSGQRQFTDDNPDQDQGRAQEYTGRQTFAGNAAQYSGNDRLTRIDDGGAGDGQSVVSGKSVSEGLDPGGRRTIKQQK